jgi:hypothetical protein
MDTPTTPLALPQDIRQRINSYQPRSLTDEEWAACRDSVTRLVAAAPPADEQDAATLLSSATTFVAAVGGIAGTTDLEELLTPQWIDRFSDMWRERDGSTNALRNHRARLNRLRRAANGEDGALRIRRTDRPHRTTSRPYGHVEEKALRAASWHAPANIGRAIRTALDLAVLGFVGEEAFANGLDEDAFRQAQDWVKAHRLPALTSHELRRFWCLEKASKRTVFECLALGITGAELDGLLQHLGPGDPCDVVVVLRSM